MDMATKAKGKPRIGTAPKRGYPDLHDHLKTLDEGRAAGHRRSRDRQGHRDASAGALAVPRRHRREGPQGVPLHQRQRRQGQALRHSRSRSACSPANREIYRIGMACDLDKIDETWNRAVAHPIPPRVVETAPCQEIVITGKALDKPGHGPRRAADPDLDAGLGRLALYDARRNTSPRIPRPASRTWASIAAR